MLVAVHVTIRRVTLTVSVRQHLWSPPTDRRYGSGRFSDAVVLPPGEGASFLESLDVVGTSLRPTAYAIVLDAPDDITLPQGAYRIPESYEWNTTGNTGSVISLSYAF